jgi:Na+/H+-translocating membrane pyrophosphatase
MARPDDPLLRDESEAGPSPSSRSTKRAFRSRPHAGMGTSMGGLTIGGVIVIIGIIVAIFYSVLWGIIIALIGLLAFGGFARGRWY